MEKSRDGARGADADGVEFRRLIDRPTPELDSDRLWRRIESRLAPRSPEPWGLWSGIGWWTPRLAWGIAGLAAAALAIWLAFAGQGPVPESQMVLLTPVSPPGDQPEEAANAAPDGARLYLDVRLVRGYDGAPPGDISVAEAMGVGGADALRDARASIEALLPFEFFGLVGAGQAELEDDAPLEIELSGDYRLVARSVETGVRPDSSVRLAGIELVGRGQESMPAELNLEPGRLYFLGVLPSGAETPELVLLIRSDLRREGGR